MAGTSTILTDASGAADFLAQGSCRFALIESRHERQFAQRAERSGLRYAVVTRFEGYNYSPGRPIAMTIFRSEGPPVALGLRGATIAAPKRLPAQPGARSPAAFNDEHAELTPI